MTRTTKDIVMNKRLLEESAMAQFMSIAAVISLHRALVAMRLEIYHGNECEEESFRSFNLCMETLRRANLRWGLAGM